MIEIETAISFFLTCFLLSFIPAADNTLVAFQSITKGRIAGLSLTLGVCTAIAIHLTGIIFGLSTLIKTTPGIFYPMKVVGAGYLIYIAWLTIKETSKKLGYQNNVDEGNAKLYWRGILMTLLNPLSPIALTIIISGFVSDCCDIKYQIMQLGMILLFSIFIVFTIISYIAHKMGMQWIHSGKVRRRIGYFSAISMAGWAIVLMIALPGT